MRHAGLLLAAAILLAACAGPPLYQPLNGARSFGYAERYVSADLYEVSYRAPNRTTYVYYATDRESDRRLQLAYDLALLRAAELVLDDGRPTFSVRRRDNDVEVDIRAGYGAYRGFSRYPRHFAIPNSMYEDEPYAVIAARVTLLVDAAATGARNSFDAATIASKLRRQYANELPP